MKTKISALLFSVFIIVVGIFGVNYLTSKRSNIKGSESVAPESSSSATPENQSVRLFDREVDYDIDNLLRNLGSQANLKVTEIVDAGFSWKSGEKTWQIDGKAITVKGAPAEMVDQLTNYLQENGFTKDELNSMVDNAGLNYGFIKNTLACLLRSAGEYASGQYDIEIRCGPLPKEFLSQNDDDKTTQIKAALAEKHNWDPSLIKLDYSMEEENYLKGTVQFLEEDQTEPNPGNSGIFLAAKDADGKWELVFDGNGIVTCREVEPYNFPLKMVPSCYNRQTDTLVDLSQ
jgi:hypothetical protein